MDVIVGVFNFINDTSLVVGLLLLCAIVLYGFFATVLAFQIMALNKAVKQDGFSSIFTFLSFLHVGVAFVLMLSAIMIL